MLTLVGNNLKGQEVILSFEITKKSLELSMLNIFCHPPDVPPSILKQLIPRRAVFLQLCSWSLALEMGIISAGLNVN